MLIGVVEGGRGCEDDKEEDNREDEYNREEEDNKEEVKMK